MLLLAGSNLQNNNVLDNKNTNMWLTLEQLVRLRKQNDTVAVVPLLFIYVF